MADKGDKHIWNLKPLFSGDDDPEMDKQRAEVKQRGYEFINKWNDREDYLVDAKVLRRALDEYENWARKYGTSGAEGYYLGLRTAQDQSDVNLKAKSNQLTDFATKIQNDIQFFELRLAKIAEDKQIQFLEVEELKKYRHFLERLFAEAKYLLSEPEEKILNLKSVTAYSNWVKMTSEFLTKEERRVLLENGEYGRQSFSEILNLMSSRQKPVRDGAAKSFNSILKKHLDVAVEEINSILHNKKIDDELRGMDRPDLGRHLSDDIETEVVDKLVEAVSSRFEIARRYYRLKANLMGVEQLTYHERNVPYGKLDKKYSFEDSVSLINQTFGKLDSQFADIFTSFIDQRLVDIYPRKGKAGGAFCAHNLIILPTYILLNHTDQLNDVLTLAHEVGHGINNELMREKQHALYFSTPTSTAEVASTFMEDFVLQELMLEADDELRLAIMMMKLNDDVSTIFRQIAAYKFEQEMHNSFREKGFLSKEDLGVIFQKQMFAYMGEGVERSRGSENWWVYWSHFRRFFYVYSYSSGLLISKALQNSVKKEPEFMIKVKEFLAAGTSDSPKNIFRKMEIDIGDEKFWYLGLDEVGKLLAETEELAGRLGKV